MKILFVSDVRTWQGYVNVFDEVAPDVVMMGGDLVSDGVAHFWGEVNNFIIRIPALRCRLLEFLEAHKDVLKPKRPKMYDTVIELVNQCYTGEVSFEDSFGSLSKYKLMSFADRLAQEDEDVSALFRGLYEKLYQQAKESTDFLDYVIQNHVSKFYEAINYSGKKSRVFLVMGDHDFYDFPGAYDAKRINSVENVKDISGKKVLFNGLSFLGLGYMETHYLRKLRPLISLHKGSIDILLTHAQERRLPLLAQIKPKLILRGHWEKEFTM